MKNEKERVGGTDGGDKMRQIEKGTMRLGEQEGVTGTVISGWQHQSGRIKAETEAREFGERWRETQRANRQSPERLAGLFTGSY